MSQSEKAVKSVLIMIIFAFGSKILGFSREVLIAAKFGSGIETDTFFIAITATTLFSTMIKQAINTTMIPVLSEVELKEGKEGKNIHTNNLLNIIVLISLFTVIIGWILAPFVIKILAHGFKGEQFEFGVLMMRIGLPVIVISGTIGVFRGYLQSELKFIESAAADIPFNLTYILFLVFLSGVFGIKGLMVTSVLAASSRILLQIPSIKKTGYKYKFILNIKDRYVKKIVHLVPPVVFIVGIDDLNKIIDRSLASTLIEGSISALSYGNRLNTLILGIFITAITTVLFPTLSQKANKDNIEEFRNVTRYGINSILVITLPATVGIMILAEPIVRLAFERGVFDVQATYMTTGALFFYSLGIMGMGLKIFLYRVYYSLQDTKTPMINGFITVGFNIILNFILVRFMGHKGLALATSIATTATTILLLYGLNKKIESFGLIKMVRCGAKSLIASLIMGPVVHILYNVLDKSIGGNTVRDLSILFFVILVGASIYLVCIYLFKSEELHWVISLIKKKNKGKQNKR